MKRIGLLIRAIYMPLDALGILLAAFFAYQLRTRPEGLGGFLEFPVQTIVPLGDFLRFIGWFIPVWLAFFGLEGLYNVKQPRRGLDQFAGIFLGVSTGIALVIGLLFFSKVNISSRLIIGYFWLLSIVIITFLRIVMTAVERALYRYGIGVRNVIIIGTGIVAAGLVKTILNDVGLGLRLKGLIKTNSHKHTSELQGLPILGLEVELEAILADNPVDEVILADPELPLRSTERLLEITERSHALFRTVPNLFEVRSSNVENTTLGRVPVITYRQTPLEGWGKIIKRGFDIVGALMALVVLSPVFVLIALAIKLTSSGPIFFTQKRISERKSFICYKFRSMKVGASAEHQKLMQKHGIMFKLKNDHRVTGLGAFLRKTSLDELPQLWNVLKGDLSLVGPRPPMEEEVRHYSAWQKRRLLIKSGMTGLWQVSGRSNIPFDEWVRLDLTYIENWSLWLDIKIVLKTIWTVVTNRGAY